MKKLFYNTKFKLSQYFKKNSYQYLLYMSIIKNFYHYKKEIIYNNLKYQNQYQNIHLDLINIKKRYKLEYKQIISNANKDILYDLLSIMDNMESAFLIAEQEKKKYLDLKKLKIINNLHRGLSLIIKNLTYKLKKYGLTPISAVGKKFTPKLHDAVYNLERKNIENEIVIEECQKGYMLHNKLLRSSKVVVNIIKTK